MDRRLNPNNPVATVLEELEPGSEAGPDSPSSGDDTKPEPEAPSPNKRKGAQKRVVYIPIGEVEGSKSKGDTYPPSDSWAWRKYGQKPIKGSPYPRGYYRCSSLKGCPARKQVERNPVDPTMLIVTYSSDHNHPSPPHKSYRPTAASPGGASHPTPSPASRFPPEEIAVFSSQTELEFPGLSTVELGDGFRWFNDVEAPATACVLESPICGEMDDLSMKMRAEDESLFADLGELPECSWVFRGSYSVSSSAIPCCGSPS